jgi:hypothetical protein
LPCREVFPAQYCNFFQILVNLEDNDSPFRGLNFEALNLKPGNLTELLQGKRHVSAVLALKLEAIFGINASFWLSTQADYDFGLATHDFSKTLYSKLKRRGKIFRGIGLGQS